MFTLSILNRALAICSNSKSFKKSFFTKNYILKCAEHSPYFNNDKPKLSLNKKNELFNLIESFFFCVEKNKTKRRKYKWAMPDDGELYNQGLHRL